MNDIWTMTIHMDYGDTVVTVDVPRNEMIEVQSNMGNALDHVVFQAVDGTVHIIRKMDISRVVFTAKTTGW